MEKLGVSSPMLYKDDYNGEAKALDKNKETYILKAIMGINHKLLYCIQGDTVHVEVVSELNCINLHMDFLNL